MKTGESGELELRGFPSGDVYASLVELVSTRTSGDVHVYVTVTGVLYEVWGKPESVSAQRHAIVVEHARLWRPPPKRVRRSPARAAATPSADPGEAA